MVKFLWLFMLCTHNPKRFEDFKIREVVREMHAHNGPCWTAYIQPATCCTACSLFMGPRDVGFTGIIRGVSDHN